MKTLTELLAHLRDKEIHIWNEDGKLRYNAPKGIMTPDILAEMKEHKEEMLLFLARAHGDSKEQSEPIPRAPRDQPLPLSFTQQQIWFLAQFEGGNAAYNIPTALRIDGDFQIETLERCVNMLIARHDALRTSFAVLGEHPRQIIHPEASVTISIHDLQSFSEPKQSDEVQCRMTEEAQRPFDLHVAPLARVSLLRLTPHTHILIVVIHHIISDGWSMGVFLKELLALYDAISQGAPSPLPELPFQYGDFTQWQRERLQGKHLDKLLNYWQGQLAGKLSLLQLPADHPRPPRQSFRGATQPFTFPRGLTIALNRLGMQADATLFMTVFAAFDVLLYRYSGQEDIIVGVPIANRKNTEFEAIIGLFINILALRTDLSGNPTFFELLSRVRHMALGAQEHQELPFEQLIAALHPEHDMSHHPIFQYMLAFENMPMPVFQLPHVTLTPMAIFNQTAKFDCTIVFTEMEPQLSGFLEYNTDIFDATTIERIMSHFRILLEGIVAHPDQRIAEIPMLTDAEQRLFFPTGQIADTSERPQKCVHQLFEEQAARTPDAVALEFEEQHLTYQQLNRKANQVAHYLQGRGVGPNTLVGICMKRSREMIIGILGILKAGGAYVPLDPAYPQERLTFMLQDSRVALLLTQAALRETLPINDISVCCLDTDWPFFAGESEENTTSGVAFDSLAYVIYTSGSTGIPKGVLVTHAGIPNLCAAQIPAFRLSENSRVLQMASFGFDASVSEIFTTFLAGATLYLTSQEKMLPGEPLLQTLREAKISVITLPPSVLDVLAECNLPELQTVISAGEACSAEIIRRWAAGRHFLNAYGPTEATVCATINEQVDAARPFCIGRAIRDLKIYILNSNLQPCPIGVTGELHIGGRALALGYLNRPELTAEKFIPNPFTRQPGERLYKTGDLARFLPDGAIEYLGRIDQQVKIRGFRIELGEIESRMRQHATVSQSVVIMREDGARGKRLFAYVVPQNDATILVSDIRKSLKQRLPDYMIPDAIVVLDTLPVTPNGKVDRRALPNSEQTETRENFVAPRNQIEHILAMAWADVLGLPEVGVHDNFFELGGHSLLTMKLMFRIGDIFQIKLPLQLLFEAPTVAEFAKILDAVRGVNAADKLAHIGAVDAAAETRLDAEIQPDISTLDEARITDPAVVFLTGATGFLGAFLLAELLRQTRAQVYCLVRATTAEEGWQRLQQTLKKYELWHEKIASERITPILGDLALPRLGLSEEQFQMLAHDIDVIYHNGAMMNLVYPYAELKAANVEATKDVIRLACAVRLKPIHYISTLSVFLTNSAIKHRVIDEDTPLDPFDDLIQQGYAQSKWIAEKILEHARKRNVPVTIYRPATVSGHSQTGVWNTDDVVCSLLKGCIQLGKAPSREHVQVYLTPVDYVSRTIVHLSQQPTSAGRVFHLVNPTPSQWNEIMDWVKAFGYPLERLSYQAWQAALIPLATAHAQENALSHLLPVYLETEPDRDEPQSFDCQRTSDALAGTSISCPPTASLLETYFTYFIRTGFLSKP